MTPVEIEFLMRDKLTPGMEKAGKSADELGKKAGNTSEAIKKKIEEQSQVIKQVESEIKSLEKEYKKLAPGRGKMEMASEINAAKKALDEEKRVLTELSEKYKSAKDTQTSYMSQMRKIRDEMASLTNADGTVSPENLGRYNQLKTKLSEVGTAYRRVRQEQKLLTTEGNSQLSGVISGISGIAGAFSAAQGVTSLFVKDNEKLAAIQTKLQALMAITIGLQQVANTLSATSSFRMKTATAIQAGYAAAINATSGAFIKMGMSARAAGIAAQAAWAAATLGISLLIVAAIAVFDKLKEVEKVQKRLNDTTKEYNKSIITETANINRLFDKLKKVKEGTKGYQKARDEIQSKYGSYLDGLSQEIRLLKDQEGAFKAISAAAIQAAKDKAISSGTENAAEVYSKTWGENINKIQKAFKKDLGETQGAILFEQLRDSLSSGSEFSDELKKAISTFDYTTYNEVTGKANTVNFIDERIKEIEKSKKVFDNEISDLNAAFSSTLKGGDELEVQNKEYWTRIKEEAEAAKTSLGSSMEGSKKWIEYEKTIAKAQRELDKYSNSYSTNNKIQSSAYERQRDADRRRLDQMHDAVDLEIKTREETISQLDDSYDKEAQMRQLNYDKEYYEALKQQERMLRAQQDAEYNTWKKKNPNYQKQGLVFTPTTQTADQLPDDQKKELQGMFNLAFIKNEGAEKDSLKKLLESYQDYDTQRLEIEKRFNSDIAELRRQREEAQAKGDTKLVEQIDKALVQATTNKGKELMSFDFDVLKKSPEYIRAFDDIKNTSTETLDFLISEFQRLAQTAGESMDPEQLREYMNTLTSMVDELVSRDPFKALSSSRLELVRTNNKLTQTEANLKRAQDSGNQEEINKATKEYHLALDDARKAANRHVKVQKEVNEQMNELLGALSNVGNAIGGTAGEIIGFISDIGKFVTTTIDGVEMVSKAGAQAISTVEKASVILAIISAAIQLIQKLGSLIGDSHDEYLKYAEKVAEINKLRDAVNEYEIAVTKARHAEESWFSTDNLNSLKQAKEAHEKVATAYFDKLTEEQAIYQNKSGLGWTGKISKIGQQIFNAVSGNKLIDKIFGTNISDSLVDFVSGGTYSKGNTAAINNLRIETRKSSSGFLGSGIGGKSQKTEDLASWIKKQKGWENADLFDDEGFINTSLAKEVLEKYGDKLVGQTKETIEALVELKEQYDEYMEQLREYVSSMYEPLVDNFIDSLWDWFDEGKDVLDSFKDYASDTFRDIVTDAMKTMAMSRIFDGFDDQLTDLYEKYAAGDISEGELMKAVSELMGGINKKIEAETPFMQKFMDNVNSAFSSMGYDLKNTEDQTYDQTGKAGYQASMSQDTGNRLEGIGTSIQMHISNMDNTVENINAALGNALGALYRIEENTANSGKILSEVRDYVELIYRDGLKTQ